MHDVHRCSSSLSSCKCGNQQLARSEREPVRDAARGFACFLRGSRATATDVRAALLALQRGMGAEGGVVMDGRDTGTVVLPGSDLKIYLDAALEERARRRQEELRAVGVLPTICHR